MRRDIGPGSVPPPRPRRGAVLVAALGLLLLGTALLAGSAMASAHLTRATRSIVAVARADAEARRALGTVVQGWDLLADSLPIGARLERAIPPLSPDGPRIVVRANVQRLSPSLYAANVTVRVGDGVATLAIRRLQLLLERLALTDSTGGLVRPTPLARWSLADRR
ncbi:MAG: hypothetical protein ABIV10_03100 [Gemmatimonadaceae bacterium]